MGGIQKKRGNVLYHEQQGKAYLFERGQDPTRLVKITNPYHPKPFPLATQVLVASIAQASESS